ncbi:MAG: hypothetical protein AB7P40_15160 [Chloroflexota bacterium]
MSVNFGRFARALLLTGGLATALALPHIAGTPLLPQDAGTSAHVAMAAPAMGNDNNDDRTNDNSEERNIEGQVLELNKDSDPPMALIGMVGGNVWARIYNDQLNRSGIGLGDYVHLQGEYGEHGIFDAYQVDVDDSDNGNDNS